MERQNLRCSALAADPSMILVDTSILVAWLDPSHPEHRMCTQALNRCSGLDELAVSSVSFAELAAGGRGRDALDQDLQGFSRIDLDFDRVFRPGQAFSRCHTTAPDGKPVLPHFVI